jgi:hypothetical protein
MNCPESLELLQRGLDGEPFTVDAALEQHLAQCSLCRARHTAARRLLEGLKASPRPAPPGELAGRIVATLLRDRQRRRIRLRRSLLVTAGLAAAILLMYLGGYLTGPNPNDGKSENAPLAHKGGAPPEPAKKDPIVPVPPRDKAKEDSAPALVALTGRLADKTLDQAKVLWTAANPVEGMPIGEMPAVPELDPPALQAKQEVSEGLNAVTRSARRAIDYFARELPMPEVK